MQLGTVLDILTEFPPSREVRLTIKDQPFAPGRVLERTTVFHILSQNFGRPRAETFTLFGYGQFVVRERHSTRIRHLGQHVITEWVEIEAWPDIKSS